MLGESVLFWVWLAGKRWPQSVAVNLVASIRSNFGESALCRNISGLWGCHVGKAVAPDTERLEARILDGTLHCKPWLHPLEIFICIAIL